MISFQVVGLLEKKDAVILKTDNIDAKGMIKNEMIGEKIRKDVINRYIKKTNWIWNNIII